MTNSLRLIFVMFYISAAAVYVTLILEGLRILGVLS